MSEDRALLAAEYALGLLDGDALAEARALAAADPQFRAEAARWSGDLAPLLDEVTPVIPPRGAWDAIERHLGPAAAKHPAANDNADALRRRIKVWQGAAIGASALAASLAMVVVAGPAILSPPVETAAPAPLVAMLGDDARDMMLVASWDPASRRLMVAAASDLPPDPTHAHELWMIPADGKPRSLGTMPGPKMRAELPMPMAAQFREGVTLALSVEPMGGSPTGLPTGPVVASGKLERA
ncbi:MAG: anti-sigma factor [Sphingomicrobium sp.]